MDDYKIIPDEVEIHAEKKRNEYETFRKHIAEEKAKKKLMIELQAGLHYVRASCEMLDGEMLRDFDSVWNDERVVQAALDLVKAAKDLSEVMTHE